MKRLAFAIVGTAALTLAACNNNNEDAVKNAELNQPEPRSQRDCQPGGDGCRQRRAAAQANIQNAAQQENASVDNTVNPTDADEQNVSGM